MIKITRKPVIIVSIALEFAALQMWFACSNFLGLYHFSLSGLSLRLNESIYNDDAIPIAIVRFFHNKLSGTLTDIYTIVIHYFDIFFLIQLLSVVGAFGFFYGCLEAIRTRFKPMLLCMIGIVILVLGEILIHPRIYFPLKIGVLALPYIIVSLFGIKRFEQKKSNSTTILLIILVLTSIAWFFFFKTPMGSYCS